MKSADGRGFLGPAIRVAGFSQLFARQLARLSLLGHRTGAIIGFSSNFFEDVAVATALGICCLTRGLTFSRRQHAGRRTAARLIRQLTWHTWATGPTGHWKSRAPREMWSSDAQPPRGARPPSTRIAYVCDAAWRDRFVRIPLNDNEHDRMRP
jgi:hypothetical protein